MCLPENGDLWYSSLENNALNIPRAIWWENEAVHLIDQTLLPQEEEILIIKDVNALITAIKRLSVRGAPALGIAGAYGVLLVASDWQNEEGEPRWAELRDAVTPLRESRPTAVNLAWAIDRVILAAESQQPASRATAYSIMHQEAADIHIEDEERCKKIGMHGAEVLSESANVITHCNAGALATGGIGTALGVIYAAVMQGKQVHVYSDETRPLLQGARLTAWELERANIPVTVMTDGMAASLMHQRNIDAVVVGADRIANNGDTANKIGTYQLAIAAQAHDVPFYVAAPTSTIDISLPSGDEIPIEMRESNEVIRWGDIQTAPSNVDVYSPAFDVMPVHLIKGIITDVGIATPPVNFQDFLQSAG